MEYDRTLWKLEYGDFGEDCLVYIGPRDKPVSLYCEKNVRVFFRGKFEEGFSLVDFDTSKMVDLSYMFFGCKFPEGFSLSSSFSTESAHTMDHMFYMCKFNKDFTFPEGFSTSNVRHLRYMYAHCKFPEELKVPCDLSSALDTSGMFSGSTLCQNNLEGSVNTNKIETATRMFERCTIHGDFTLVSGLANAKDVSHLFEQTKFNGEIIIPEKLDFRKAKSVNNLLFGCNKAKEIANQLLLPAGIAAEELYDADKTV